MIAAYVGSGGKTTTLFSHAQRYLGQNKKVFVTTSTHMKREKDTFVFAGEKDWSEQLHQMQEILNEKGYLMAGQEAQNNKIKSLPLPVRQVLIACADVTLIEADGSRQMPLKYPDWSKEPVLDFCADEIWVLAGLKGLNRPLQESVFRHELACAQFGWDPREPADLEKIQKLIQKGYIEPFKRHQKQAIVIIGITNGTEESVKEIKKQLKEEKICVL